MKIHDRKYTEPLRHGPWGLNEKKDPWWFRMAMYRTWYKDVHSSVFVLGLAVVGIGYGGLASLNMAFDKAADLLCAATHQDPCCIEIPGVYDDPCFLHCGAKERSSVDPEKLKINARAVWGSLKALGLR